MMLVSRSSKVLVNFTQKVKKNSGNAGLVKKLSSPDCRLCWSSSWSTVKLLHCCLYRTALPTRLVNFNMSLRAPSGLPSYVEQKGTSGEKVEARRAIYLN
jgi:hypothetical protein